MSSHTAHSDHQRGIFTTVCDIFLWSLFVITYSVVTGRILGWGVDYLMGPGIASMFFTRFPPRLPRREAFRSGVRIGLLMMLAVGPAERLLRLALYRLAGEQDYAVHPPHHLSALDPQVVFTLLFASLLVGIWLPRMGPTGAFRTGFFVGCTMALELLARSLALVQTRVPVWTWVCTAVYVLALTILVVDLVTVQRVLVRRSAPAARPPGVGGREDLC